MLDPFDEHGFELGVAAGLLCVVRLLLIPLLDLEFGARGEERKQAVVIDLQVVVDQRVIVALVALHVAAEKDPAGVPGQEVRFRGPIQDQPCRGAGIIVRAVGGQQFPGKLMPRFVHPRRLDGYDIHSSCGMFVFARRSINVRSRNSAIRRGDWGVASSRSIAAVTHFTFELATDQSKVEFDRLRCPAGGGCTLGPEELSTYDVLASFYWRFRLNR